MADKKYSPAVQELADLIKENNWEDKFNQAIAKCRGLQRFQAFPT